MIKSKSSRAIAFFLTGLLHGQILPPPSFDLPQEPKLASYVITAAGRRLLLNYTDLEVSYNPATRKLISNKPGWWIVNYPLDRIKNFDGGVEALSQVLFNASAGTVRNWYLKTPGTPAAEPAEPSGPAPIDLTPNPTLIVDQRNPNSRDSNPGTEAAPLATISEAVRRAGPGTLIHVRYGIYREQVIITASGTKDAPIRIEGVRTSEGMPIVLGNDPFPGNTWAPTEWPGVFRSNFINDFEGQLTAGGRSLIERSQPTDLKPGEFAINRASQQLIRPALNGNVDATENKQENGKPWRLVKPTQAGLLNLTEIDDSVSVNSLYWASTWVWIDPQPGKRFDPAKPAPLPGDLVVDGTFRAFRATGAENKQQTNKYRVWANGDPVSAVINSTNDRYELTQPRALRNSGSSDEWFQFPFREGWNHLVFAFDTTVRPQELSLRFNFPATIGKARVSANPPARLDAPNDAVPTGWISEYLLLGPFAAQPDRGIYARLPNDANPNGEAMEAAARGSELFNAKGDFVQIRGFDIRGGVQYQQQAQVQLSGMGTVLEGSIMSGSEVGGAFCAADKDRNSPPTILRNNWIVDAGNVGFGCGGNTDLLTAENLITTQPGRSPVIFEHNVVLNSNWAGFQVGWSAGGSKSVHLTGLVFRYNLISGLSGPGIWLDWENFGNRIEGNLIRDVYKFGIGVEASPGPNLIANNVLVGLKAEPGYATSLIASWDSSNTWAAFNTVNGRWNNGKGWVFPEKAEGISLGAGGTRPIRWGPLKNPHQAYMNNIVLGFEQAIVPQATDDSRGNYSDSGIGGIVLGRTPEFRSLGLEDYRLIPTSPLSRAAIRTAVTDLVGHDFNGLIRHRSFPDAVGAFRAEPAAIDSNESVMEVEYEDGRQNLINSAAPAAVNRAPVASSAPGIVR